MGCALETGNMWCCPRKRFCLTWPDSRVLVEDRLVQHFCEGQARLEGIAASLQKLELHRVRSADADDSRDGSANTKHGYAIAEGDSPDSLNEGGPWEPFAASTCRERDDQADSMEIDLFQEPHPRYRSGNSTTNYVQIAPGDSTVAAVGAGSTVTLEASRQSGVEDSINERTSFWHKGREVKPCPVCFRPIESLQNAISMPCCEVVLHSQCTGRVVS